MTLISCHIAAGVDVVDLYSTSSLNTDDNACPSVLLMRNLNLSIVVSTAGVSANPLRSRICVESSG